MDKGISTPFQWR